MTKITDNQRTKSRNLSYTLTQRPVFMEATLTQEEIVEHYLNAYNAFDVPGLLLHLDDDIEFINKEEGTVTHELHGKEEFEELALQTKDMFLERRQTILNIHGFEGGLKVKIKYHGILAHPASRKIEKGTIIDVVGTSYFHFRQGKIVKLVDES